MAFKWNPGEADRLFVDHGRGATPGLYDLYEWHNCESFSCAWELVKQAQSGQFAAWELAHALGCSQRTIYRWLNEDTAFPQAYFQRRMAQLFCNLIGEEWMEKAEQLQIALGTKKQTTQGGSTNDH